MKSDVSTCQHISITHDGWSSCNTESYSCVTAHFITADWKLVNAVLQTKKVEGSHTGENIAQALSEVKVSWSLPNIIAVTDNAANEKKAFEILNWIRFGCYGHRINLVVKNALSSSNEITRVIAKGRKLVTFFHQSTSANDCLLGKQRLLLKEEQVGHKLIMDVPTRWNSTVAMLRRLIEQSPAVLALASDSGDILSKTAIATIKSFAYSFEEQSLVEKLVDVLTPFERATAIVCADKSPTMHKILPVIMKLGKCIVLSDDDPECIKKMKKKMSDEIIKRCARVDNDEEISLMACILNPLMKQLEFLSQEQRDHAQGQLTEKALELASTPVQIKTEPLECHERSTPAEPSLPSVSGLETDGKHCSADVLPEQSEKVDVNEIISKTDESKLSNTNSSPPTKKLKVAIKNEDIDDWLCDVIYVGGSQKSSVEMIHDEISRYTKSEISEEEIQLSILEWWKKNQYLYPRLSILAKKYLCIPASSVPSERVFSLAGQLVSKKRARMHSANVDMFIFLNKNMERYWK